MWNYVSEFPGIVAKRHSGMRMMKEPGGRRALQLLCSNCWTCCDWFSVHQDMRSRCWLGWAAWWWNRFLCSRALTLCPVPRHKCHCVPARQGCPSPSFWPPQSCTWRSHEMQKSAKQSLAGQGMLMITRGVLESCSQPSQEFYFLSADNCYFVHCMIMTPNWRMLETADIKEER